MQEDWADETGHWSHSNAGGRPTSAARRNANLYSRWTSSSSSNTPAGKSDSQQLNNSNDDDILDNSGEQQQQQGNSSSNSNNNNVAGAAEEKEQQQQKQKQQQKKASVQFHQQIQQVANDQTNNNNYNGGKEKEKEAAGTDLSGTNVVLVHFHSDSFALTTAFFINVILFALSLVRISFALNSDVFNYSPSVSTSAAIWITVANGFAVIIFLYYLIVEIVEYTSSASSSSSSTSSTGKTKTAAGGVSEQRKEKDTIGSRRDRLGTVWISGWAAAVATAYCEGGSGGGLALVTIPVFVIIAPAFRISFVAVVVAVCLSCGVVIALFLSHFPGSTFRRFELPLVPAEVIINFTACICIAAWISYRSSKETQQLSEHYTTMLKLVASTGENLLRLRTNAAVSNLSQIPPDLFAAPQEKRVISELLVFAQFLHELSSYFPPHIADAVRARILMASIVQQQQQQQQLQANNSGGSGGGGNSSHLNNNHQFFNFMDEDFFLYGQAFLTRAQQQQQQQQQSQQLQKGGSSSKYQQQDDGGGGDEDDYYYDEEDEPFEDAFFSSALKKRMSTVMQVTILDFPSFDASQSTEASQWLSDCALNRIEAHDGVVDQLTPSTIVASFNFHRPCAVRHARLACECALSIASALSAETDSTLKSSLTFCITIDTAQNVGGTVGTGFTRRDSLAGEGIDTITRLVPLANILAVPILLTERVQKNLGNTTFDTIPVDVADIRWFQRERKKQIVLYELRGTKPRASSSWNATQISETFANAFSHFRRGELKEAEDMLSRWEREVKKESAGLSAADLSLQSLFDPTQAKRLKGICSTYRKHEKQYNFPKPFCRRNVLWQLFVSEMPSDPYHSPLKDRLRHARKMLMTAHASSAGGAFSPMQGGGGGNSPGDNKSPDSPNNNPEATPLANALKHLKKKQQVEEKDHHEDEGGLMTMFVVDDDDDDNNFNNTNNNQSSSMFSDNNNNNNNTFSDTTNDNNKNNTGNPDAFISSPSYGALTPPPKNDSAASFGSAGESHHHHHGGGGRSTVDRLSSVPLEVKDIHEETWTRSSEPIGAGGFSEVFLGLGPSGCLVAMKYFLLESAKSSVTELQNEVTLLSELKHENIVSYVSCAITPTHFVIVMEYVSGGSLEALLKQFGPLKLPALKKYLLDILQGLQYLHSSNSVHCDVKPGNALLHGDGVVKLTDFGSSINSGGQQAATSSSSSSATAAASSMPVMEDPDSDLIVRGTAHYMAPEAAKNKIAMASDIWSLGVTVLELVTGKLPWPDRYRRMSPQNFILALSGDEVPVPEIPPDLDESVKDFVSQCLHVDPNQRSTLDELLVSHLLAS